MNLVTSSIMTRVERLKRNAHRESARGIRGVLWAIIDFKFSPVFNFSAQTRGLGVQIGKHNSTLHSNGNENH